MTYWIASLTQQSQAANHLDWSGYATVATAVLAIVLAFGAYIRRSIKSSVDNLASVLDERLATKENVNELNTRVAILEERSKSGT